MNRELFDKVFFILILQGFVLKDLHNISSRKAGADLQHGWERLDWGNLATVADSLGKTPALQTANKADKGAETPSPNCDLQNESILKDLYTNLPSLIKRP